MKRQSPSRQKPSLQFFADSEDSGKLRCSNIGTDQLSEATLPSERVSKLPHDDDRRVRVSAVV
jgi:hypothetical protein